MRVSFRLLATFVLVTVVLATAGPAVALAPSTAGPSPAPGTRAKTKAAATVHRTAPTAAPAPPSPPPGPDGDPLAAPLGVDSGILVDATNGKVLWAANPDQPRSPASLTKILTALVVLEHAKLSDTQVVTDDAYNAPGANTYALPGWTFAVDDMLWALLLVSGNDMAISLAHKASPDGTVAGFVQLMNDEAAALGATSTHMVNPHGMDAPGHVSTARDLALLTMVAMKNPTFAQMVGTVRHDIPWDNGVHQHVLVNHDRFLTLYRGTIGVKTGYTNDAGNSLVTEVTRNGATLLAVVLNAKSPAGYNDSRALYDWGFANFDALEAGSTDTIVPKSPAAFLGGGAKKPGSVGGQLPVAVGAGALSGSRPVSSPDTVPLDEILVGLLVASVGAAWFLSARHGRRDITLPQ